MTVALCALCVGELVAGAYFGFASILAHVTFWLLAGMLLVVASRVARRLCPTCGFIDVSIRTGLVAFALVVLCGFVLGTTNLLARTPYLIVEAVLLLATVRALPRTDTSAIHDRINLSMALAGILIALAGFVVAMGIGHAPFITYDSLSYHLFFPARWLQAHRISIIPTPFSDAAQAYQPANGELFFLWLMLPFHGDFLARIGQFPFYLLAATTSYALARRMGAGAGHAVYAPALLLMTPPVVEQAVGANVDLICAAMFLTSLYLGIVAVDGDRRRDWAVWGISVGLFLGSKYLALVYLPALLAIPFVREPRARALWALPGIAAFGAPWYLRNWLVAGSPIYPATFNVAGLTIAQGAYTRQAMLQSFAHTSDPRVLAVSLIHAFGTTMCLFAIPAAVVVLAAVIKRKAWWPAGFVMLAAAAMVPLCWLGVGDNADSRFLLPAVVTVVSLLPLSFGENRALNAAIHGLFAVGIAWLLVGLDAELPVSVPWYQREWLSLRGIIDPRFLPHFALLAAIAAFAWRMASRRGWTVAVTAALIGAAGATLAIGAETWCVPSRCDFLKIPSPHIKMNFLYGWRWLAAHVNGANIAYTGDNLPYPLSGSHLGNVVYYVNIDEHRDWRFHDYARAFRRASARASDSARLATSSGVLIPLSGSDGTDLDAPRPRFERMSGDRGAWMANLEARGIGYLFISALGPYEIDYVWHNAQGFPIEDEWARAEPEAFHLVHENSDVRIYEVRRR